MRHVILVALTALVVVVSDGGSGTAVTLASGQQLAVELTMGTSGGIDPWVLATAPDRAVLHLSRTEHSAPAQLPGASGTDRFVFDAVAAGTTDLAATSTVRSTEERLTFQLRVVVR